MTQFHFPYPLLITLVHLMCTFLFAQASTSSFGFVSTFFICYYFQSNIILSPKKNSILILFSILFSSNIFFSNSSLLAISLDLNQIIRLCIPIFTVFFSYTFLKQIFSIPCLLSVPVVRHFALTDFSDLFWCWDDNHH